MPLETLKLTRALYTVFNKLSTKALKETTKHTEHNKTLINCNARRHVIENLNEHENIMVMAVLRGVISIR